MSDLYIFLIGIIFSLLILPIISCISDIIYTLSELIKTKMSVTISRDSLKITEISNEVNELNTEDNTNTIGFKYPTQEYIEYENDDCRLKNTSKINKNKVGF